MSDSTILIELPSALYARLQHHAKTHDIAIQTALAEAIEDYVEDEDTDEGDYLTKAEILSNFKEAMQDAIAGRVRPARDVLNEIRKELEDVE